MFALAPTHVHQWIAANKESFSPPICNKLMYRGSRLSIMFVGGPNQRRDFHCEAGSEFFYQFQGDMELRTLSNDQQVSVRIPQGHVLLLPGNVPHSPQRFPHTMGLVIERNRYRGEMDSLTWYRDDVSSHVEFSKSFECQDLGKDLLKVVHEYQEFKKSSPQVAISNSLSSCLPTATTTTMPPPCPLLNLMENEDPFHDVDFNVFLQSHTESELCFPGEEIFLWQLEGRATIHGASFSSPVSLEQSECCVLALGSVPIKIQRTSPSKTLVVVLKSKPSRL